MEARLLAMAVIAHPRERKDFRGLLVVRGTTIDTLRRQTTKLLSAISDVACLALHINMVLEESCHL